MFETGAAPGTIVEAKGLKQVSDTGFIQEAINRVLAQNQDQVESYRAGKTKVFGFFVGQIMKETEGKVNPGILNELLKKTLEG